VLGDSITTDHNYVWLKRHAGRDLGCATAMPAALGQPGVLPGSMGDSSFHVEGRGHEAALCSSAHGAGRALSRTAARAEVTERELRRQMNCVWYDYRLSDRLRDEAPSAYKDITTVLRAQRDLVRVTTGPGTTEARPLGKPWRLPITRPRSRELQRVAEVLGRSA
jgi:tRNA-splicing ligase RtcB